MFTQTKKTSATPVRKLHSIHSLLIGRNFTGEIEVGKSKSWLTFSPASTSIANGKLELTGNVAVKSPSGKIGSAANVKATLLSTQGSLTAAPPTPNGADANLLGSLPSNGLPVTDATGTRASVAVLYFKLSPLNGKALGLPFDLTSVQLNGRLNPTDNTARALQFWYSVAVRALYGQSPDESLAARSIGELNQILKA